MYEQYRLDETILEIERLYLDLSRIYIQMVRDKSSVGDEKEKKEVIYCIYQTMLAVIKMFATVCPFVSEEIYLIFKKEFKLKEESVHLT